MSIYLDWAATSPPKKEFLFEAAEIACTEYGNPSSLHSEGKKAASLLLDARKRCALSLGVKPDTLIFTSGGTESDHIPMLSLLQRPVRGTIAISAIEHPAIIEQAKILESAGWKTLVIPVTSDGFVTKEAVLQTIHNDTAFVAVMAVNNETGAIQPIEEIGEALIASCTGRKKPHFHVDAVQAVGKISLTPGFPGIDSLSISAHKIQGPRGIGLLYLEKRIEPFIRGGGQESGIRPGTENLAGAWAFSRALEESTRTLENQKKSGTPTEIETLMAHIIVSLTAIPQVSIIPENRSPVDHRFSPWIIQCTNTVLPGEVLVRALSDQGMYISMGSACSSRKKTRPVLNAMQISQQKQQNSFRISIGPSTTIDEIETFISTLKSVLSKF